MASIAGREVILSKFVGGGVGDVRSPESAMSQRFSHRSGEAGESFH